jgi:HAD superfamily hydrolase (TIGR01548 family)
VVTALPNAVAFRTLSKAWGLAGLRVGYAVGAPEAIAALRVAGHPYPVSGPSLHLARRRLERDGDVSSAFVANVRAERDALTEAMRALGLDAQRSQANFVFARSPRADWLRDGLAGLGIGVRGWPGHPGLGDAVRINVPGDPGDVARLHHALRAVLAPDAILFDVDGVLVDVSGSYREAIRATAAAFGVEVSGDEIAAAKVRGNANNDWVLTRALLAARGVDVPLDAVIAEFERRYQGHADTPGLKLTERARFTREQLARLRGRLPLALVTGRPRRDAMELVEREGWASLFDAAVVMSDTAPKPDPAPVRAALDRLGVRTGWMIGDTVDDVRAARAAGVVPLGMVPPGEDAARVGPVLLAAGAARVLSRADDLEALLP